MKIRKILNIVNAVVGTKLFVIPDPALDREDIIQELALHVWEMDKQGRVRSEGEAWVIASNALIDMFRKWSSAPITTSLDEMLDEVPEDMVSYDDLLLSLLLINVEDVALDNILHDSAKPAFEMLALLDDVEGQQLQTLQVEVSGREIADANQLYRWEIRDIEKKGYAPPAHCDKYYKFIFVGSRITYPFLARLTKALMALGATPKMAVRVIQTGLRMICGSYEATKADKQLLRDYRRRAGANIWWRRYPKGDITLTRGNLRLFIEA